jgi:hypothetical protein
VTSGYAPAVHVVRALRQAVVLVALCLLVGAAAAGVWALTGGGFLHAFAVALLVLAFVIGTAGGTTLSRATADSERAFLGWGPERDDEYGGSGGLTGLGMALFVGLPLFVLGLALLDLG